MANTGVVGGGTLKEQLKVVNALTNAVVSASAGFVTVDRQGYNSVLFALSSGAIVSSGSIVPKVQHSPDGSAWTDTDATNQGWGDIAGAAIGANTTRQVSVDCRLLERYVRIYGTLTGTSVALGGVAVLGATETLPAV